MRAKDKRIGIALAAIGALLLISVWVFMSQRQEPGEGWGVAAQGFLAVATPCCYQASLWDSLDTITPDGQRARPASVEEAAVWLDTWPYRGGEERDPHGDAELAAGVQSSEIRCRGPQPDGRIPRYEDDEQALIAIQDRRGCELNKWKVWSADTANAHKNERHAVWADDDGHFHGRVDYWEP